MKKTSTIILLLLLAVSVSFAQSKKQETIKKHFNNNKKIGKTAIKSPNSTTAATLYDFTTGSNKFYGGASGAVEVEAGVWGMIAGDANSDGFIDASDFVGPDNDKFQSGYLNSDTGMDGFVDGSDFVPVDNNKFKGTAVPN